MVCGGGDGYGEMFSREERNHFSVPVQVVYGEFDNAGFVKKYIQLPQTDLEKIESLEQLRVMWHGFSIVVPMAEEVPGPGVDTAEDLENVRKMMT